MTATETVLIVLFLSVVVIAALATLHSLQQLRRRRTLAELVGRPCPRCGQIFGLEAARNAKPRMYRWALARGHNVRELDLPAGTLTILCPHCKAELNFRLDRRLFENPFRQVPAQEQQRE